MDRELELGEGAECGLLRSTMQEDAPVFVAGEGVEVITPDGTRIIDAISGVGVTCLGYDVPRIVDAMAQQASTLPYAHALRFETPALRRLAQRVASLMPGSLNFSFFVSGGSEAVDTAIKFARQYWLECGREGKWRVIGRWPSYHGNTIAALSVGWHAARRKRHHPLLLDFPHIEAPNSYRGCGHCRGMDGCTLECANELERVLLREGPETISAFIAEPMVGAAGGAFVPPPGYFAAIRDICDRYDILFIADEVITGFGRTGQWFGMQHWDIEPDVIVFGKGVSAGFAPLAGISVSERLVDAFTQGSRTFEHSFTMGGHPTACAAGVAAIDEMLSLDVPTVVRNNESALFAALERLRESELVGDIRGRGYFVGVELVADRQTREVYPANLGIASRLGRLAFEERVLIYPCTGVADGKGDFFLLMPAFTMSPELFPEVAERIGRALERLEAELRLDGSL